MSKWIKVSDRLPEMGKAVLVTDGEDVERACYSRLIGMGCNDDWNFERSTHGAGTDTDLDLYPITHWQPLLEPPRATMYAPWRFAIRTIAETSSALRGSTTACGVALSIDPSYS